MRRCSHVGAHFIIYAHADVVKGTASRNGTEEGRGGTTSILLATANGSFRRLKARNKATAFDVAVLVYFKTADDERKVRFRRKYRAALLQTVARQWMIGCGNC